MKNILLPLAFAAGLVATLGAQTNVPRFEDDPAFPLLLDPQAAASPVSAVAAEMATAARLSLTACSLRVAVGARPAGAGLEPARGAARAFLLAPHDTSSAPLDPGVCVN